MRIINGKHEKGSIFLNIYQEDGSVIIRVRDDGGGISAGREAAQAVDAAVEEVRCAVKASGGDLEGSFEPEKGADFLIRIPFAYTILPVVMIRIQGESYAVALNSVLTAEDVPAEEIRTKGDGEIVCIRETDMPLIHMERLLDLKSPEKEPEFVKVLVVKKSGKYAALVVDELVGQQEAVIKSLGNFIRSGRMISGAAIVGDGDIALVLDVNAFIS